MLRQHLSEKNKELSETFVVNFTGKIGMLNLEKE
jgi:hypothetical protein